MTVETRWSAKRIAELIQTHRGGRSDGPLVATVEGQDAIDASRASGRPSNDARLLHLLTWLDHHEFIDNAYRRLY